MKNKIAFFDMDGTLVAPVFMKESGDVVFGFPEQEWIDFCNSEREEAYDRCITIGRIVDEARRLRDIGYDVKILTVTLSEGEEVAKKFLLRKRAWDCIFSDIIFVTSEDSKIEYIKKYLEDNNINPQDCILVEDSFSAVLKSIPLGIKGVHISHVLAALSSGGYHGAG